MVVNSWYLLGVTPILTFGAGHLETSLFFNELQSKDQQQQWASILQIILVSVKSVYGQCFAECCGLVGNALIFDI